MTISDKRFGAEIVTKKSKLYKFDDEHWIIEFIKSNKIEKKDIAEFYFTNFSIPNQLIKLADAHFLQSPSLKSPMNGNIAAFENEDSLEKTFSKTNGNKITWEEMQQWRN